MTNTAKREQCKVLTFSIITSIMLPVKMRMFSKEMIFGIPKKNEIIRSHTICLCCDVSHTYYLLRSTNKNFSETSNVGGMTHWTWTLNKISIHTCRCGTKTLLNSTMKRKSCTTYQSLAFAFFTIMRINGRCFTFSRLNNWNRHRKNEKNIGLAQAIV